MELIEAVQSRRSIRGYKPDPVPREVLTRILEVSLRAPSALNTQPCEFTVLGGEALEELKRANVAQLAAGVPQTSELGNETPTGVYRERQVGLAIELFKLLGITREDRQKRQQWFETQASLFNAPNAIIISVDKSALGARSIFDAGIMAQTIALVAQEFGLGTCIQQAAINYPDVVRKTCGIPDSKLIVIGIALGYPDPDYPANSLVTSREPLENIVSWRGV